jgi:hypothetical protein
VIQAFGSFFNLSGNTIGKDLAFVADRLGDKEFPTTSLPKNP